MINPKDVENVSDEELKELLGEDFFEEHTNCKGDDENGSDTVVQ